MPLWYDDGRQVRSRPTLPHLDSRSSSRGSALSSTALPPPSRRRLTSCTYCAGQRHRARRWASCPPDLGLEASSLFSPHVAGAARVGVSESAGCLAASIGFDSTDTINLRPARISLLTFLFPRDIPPVAPYQLPQDRYQAASGRSLLSCCF